ncbi:helicase-like transcription factor [Fusarium agapanthi]|uniref:Helicase-like transcription factor n=1 Tax=Fusarium agapanthi TaxID=1803897 RepID=A0A9P5EAY1_9HYPO|nr:helicase-like transcription factor [Fusarium agapanthi]
MAPVQKTTQSKTQNVFLLEESSPAVHLAIIILEATSSFFKNRQESETTVTLRECGSIIKLSIADTGAYAGILKALFPPGLLHRPSMKLNAVLTAPASLRVIILSHIDEAAEIGTILSNNDLFLQHPSPRDIEYFELEVEYFNPHYLVIPGSCMPQLEDHAIEYKDSTSSASLALDDQKKGQLIGIFDTAADLSIRPTTKPSLRLQTRLKDYHLKALTVMSEKECTNVESPQCPSLWVARHASNDGHRSSQERFRAFDNIAIPGWQAQIKNHIMPGQIRVALYHGTCRQSLAKEFRNNDIVLTTYQTLRSEWTNRGPLFTEQWFRVVLDEAHRIGNRSTLVFHAACELQSSRRWCLTGTPIVNSIDNYGALLAFTQMKPLVTKATFDHWISNPIQDNVQEGLRKLRILVEATCLRRTKSSISQALPPPTVREEKVDLYPYDRALYDFFESEAAKNATDTCKNYPANASETGRKKKNALSLIQNLRRICDHGEDLLAASDIEVWRLQTMRFAARQQPVTNDSVDSYCKAPPSAKVQRLIQNIRLEQTNNLIESPVPPVKSVVFSYWTKMLDLVEKALLQASFLCERIDGQYSIKQREKALSRFANDPCCTVILATLGSGGEGIDLTSANHVHLLEPHWNPMAEEQAIARVHRIGQQRHVTATKYITPGSIEEKIEEWLARRSET